MPNRNVQLLFALFTLSGFTGLIYESIWSHYLKLFLGAAAFAESIGLPHDRIILSAKVSGVQDLVDVYRKLAARCDYPLHLGLTEAGMGAKGIVASAAALGLLLQEGIGDTIRVSLTPAPGGDRTEEVQVAQQVLQSLGIRSFVPQVSACPGCGRTTSTFFQEMAEEIQGYLRSEMPRWRERYRGAEALRVAVMGCVVNGPGEAREADLGVASGNGKGQIFVKGQVIKTVPEADIVATLIEEANRLAAEMGPDAPLGTAQVLTS